MKTHPRTPAVLLAVLAALGAPSTHAAMAVIDVRAVAQMVQQLRTLQQQLSTAREQLTETRATFEALNGGRGMEQLLAGQPRQYLPADYAELEATLGGTSLAYNALAQAISALVDTQAVLPPQQLDAFEAPERMALIEARTAQASNAAVSRAALAEASARFASLEQLVYAIGTADDPKAIFDLNARILAESTQLQNEAIKLAALFQVQASDEALRQQRLAEQGIADTGRLRNLPALGL